MTFHAKMIFVEINMFFILGYMLVLSSQFHLIYIASLSLCRMKVEKETSAFVSTATLNAQPRTPAPAKVNITFIFISYVALNLI